MLDHLHRQHDVEPRAFGRKRLGRGAAIVDGEAGPRGMRLRDLDIARRGVDRRHGGAKTRQRLGEKPGAAADVEQAEPAQGLRPVTLARASLDRKIAADHVAQKGDADRVQLVQRRHRPVLAPPFVAKPVESRDILRIDRSILLKLFRLSHAFAIRWALLH